jgi:hypothetical protein
LGTFSHFASLTLRKTGEGDNYRNLHHIKKNLKYHPLLPFCVA